MARHVYVVELDATELVDLLNRSEQSPPPFHLDPERAVVSLTVNAGDPVVLNPQYRLRIEVEVS
jgi:hypothetical protein